LREKIEFYLKIEGHFLNRAAEEILSGELTQELKKYVSFAVLPRQKMNMPEFRKALRLRKILFGSRQKKKMPGWVYDLNREKILAADMRIAERFRADLPKKLLAFASVF